MEGWKEVTREPPIRVSTSLEETKHLDDLVFFDPYPRYTRDLDRSWPFNMSRPWIGFNLSRTGVESEEQAACSAWIKDEARSAFPNCVDRLNARLRGKPLSRYVYTTHTHIHTRITTRVGISFRKARWGGRTTSWKRRRKHSRVRALFFVTGIFWRRALTTCTYLATIFALSLIVAETGTLTVTIIRGKKGEGIRNFVDVIRIFRWNPSSINGPFGCKSGIYTRSQGKNERMGEWTRWSLSLTLFSIDEYIYVE